jgi:hypothetical protein
MDWIEDLEELAHSSYRKIVEMRRLDEIGEFPLPSYIAQVEDRKKIYFGHIIKAFRAGTLGLRSVINIAEMGCADGIVSIVAYRTLEELRLDCNIQAIDSEKKLAILSKQNIGDLPINIRWGNMLDQWNYSPPFSKVDIFYAYHLPSLEESSLKLFAAQASHGARLIIPRIVPENRMNGLLNLIGVSGKLIDPREIESFYNPLESYAIFQKR